MVGRGKVIDFEQARYELSATREITLDECHTKDTLKNEIYWYIDNMPINDGDKIDIYQYIITSFSKTGLIETYNDLGYDKWYEMMEQMIYKECVARYIEKVSGDDSH